MKTFSKEKLAPLVESGGEGTLDRAPACDGGADASQETPTEPGSPVPEDGLQHAISAATVKVYVRHRSGCSHCSDRYYRHCPCPKWIYENYDGKDYRYSAKTRSWNKAEKIRQDIEDSHDPVKAELKKLKETQQAKRIPISDAVECYLSDVEARHLAFSTQKHCRLTVGKRLLPWSERSGHRYLDELGVSQLTKWRSTWTLSSQSTQNEQQRAVTFFGFCMRQGWLERNPARLLSRIQVRRTPTDYFPRDEFEQLIRATYRFTRSWGCKNGSKAIWPILVRTMVLLMRWSGLRISDAVNLERVRLVADKIILYQHKTGQPVYVPLPHEVAESLRALPPLGKTLNPRFFFKTDQCLRRGVVDVWERAFHELFELADIRGADGTSKCCHSHMLRDTFAIENLLAGVPIDQVSVLLGHASIKTTERHYAPWVRARQEQLEQSVAKAHAVQGITKSAADVTDVPRIERETARHRKKVTAARSASSAVDPKRSAASRRAWITIRAKREAARQEKIGEPNSRAA